MFGGRDLSLPSVRARNNVTRDGAEPYCTYHVIPEFPSFLVLSIFVIATLLAVMTHMRKQFT